jgi:hypothetical protein
MRVVEDGILLNGLKTNTTETKRMLQQVQTIITKAKCNALGVYGDGERGRYMNQKETASILARLGA